MLAEVRLFAGNFAPRAWASCEGQLLSIASNTALFSLLGTIYGGDGRTSFALPDLRSRVPIGSGNGPGLTSRREGQRGGQEIVTLIPSQLPSHNHIASAHIVASDAGTPADLNSGASGGSLTDLPFTTPDTPSVAMRTGTVVFPSLTGNTGGTQAHNNMQPSLALYYIICTQGVFPSRN